jgi:hypothetical protein
MSNRCQHFKEIESNKPLTAEGQVFRDVIIKSQQVQRYANFGQPLMAEEKVAQP